MDPFIQLYNILCNDSGNRGLSRIFSEIDNSILYKTASLIQALPSQAHIAIMTGFNIPPIEIDGPPGALAIALILMVFGYKVTLVLESGCKNIFENSSIEALLEIFCPSFTNRINFVYFHPITIADSLEDELKISQITQNLDCLVSIEKCGPSADGRMYRCSGADCTLLQSRSFILFEKANELGIPTIAIGDGGNEIGCANIASLVHQDIPFGKIICCRIPSTHLIMSGVSNWGGYSLAAAIILLEKRNSYDSQIKTLIEFFSPAFQRRIHETFINEGAIDPRRSQVASMDIVSIDGLPFSPFHEDFLRSIQEILNSGSAMKFSHSLKFNSVPEWAEFYLSYSQLKRLIYQLRDEIEKERNGPEVNITIASQVGRQDLDRMESTSSIDIEKNQSVRLRKESYSQQLEETFQLLLDRDLEKICRFFLKKKNELVIEYKKFSENYKIEETIENMRRMDHGRRRKFSWTERWRQPISSFRWHSAGMEDKENKQSEFKRDATDLYVELNNLKEYLELNYTGYSKILKKHDKNTGFSLKNSYLAKTEIMLPFKELDTVQDLIAKIEDEYAQVLFQNRRNVALAELKHSLKDRIVYERNTIWKDMVEMERKVANLVALPPESSLMRISRSFLIRKATMLGLSIILFLTLFFIPIFAEKSANSCMAMFAFVSFLWAFEVVPLFVPSLMIPFMVVILQIMRDTVTGEILPASAAAKQILNSMFSQVIMLLLGGFSLAAALSKYNIARLVATEIIRRAGKHPNFFILANMLVATFSSMWISNVAAPVLSFSILSPILRCLDSDNSFSKSIIMAVAFASNIGGMASPISSPQNVFAVENMANMTWIKWLGISIPLCLIADLVCWCLNVVIYRPTKNIKDLQPLRQIDVKFTVRHYFVIFVTAATIILWCSNSWVHNVTGEMGILAAVPLVSFFATGILSKEDFNNFPWNLIMLAMGGLALGEAIKSSGLLLIIGNAIASKVQHLDLWLIVVTFSLIVLIITSFISHTVGAFIIIPIVKEIGKGLETPQPDLLIMITALTCSAGMMLPISSFPNMTAVSLEDHRGIPFVSSKDFIKVGLVSSLALCTLIVTIAYLIMKLIGV